MTAIGELVRMHKDEPKKFINQLFALVDDIDEFMNDGFTAMTASAMHGCNDLIRVLVSMGADIDKLDRGDESPLVVAITNTKKHENEDTVRLLLELGADIEKTDSRGFTPISHAIFGLKERGMSTLNTVKMLIDSGANVNHQNSGGLTPIYTALEVGLIEVIHMLLDAGANVKMVTNHGSTTLIHIANQPWNEHTEEIMDLLVERGVDVNAKNSRNKTALHIVLGYQETHLDKKIRKLLDLGADVYPFH